MSGKENLIMAGNNPFKRARGFGALREEVARREKEQERRKGQLWRFFLAEDEEDTPIWFLTDEPILFYEHGFKEGGKFVNITCTGDDDCEGCMQNKARYMGAFLVVDGREYEVDERDAKGNKTGKKKTVSMRVKLLVRGQTDLAKLDRLHAKYGLATRPWLVNKTGTGTATSYNFDRGEEEQSLTKTQIKEILSQLPEKFRNMDFYDIVEANIFGIEDPGVPDEDSKKAAKETVKRQVTKIAQEDTPHKKVTKPLTRTPNTEKPATSTTKKLAKVLKKS